MIARRLLGAVLAVGLAVGLPRWSLAAETGPDLEALRQDARSHPGDTARLKAYLLRAVARIKALSSEGRSDEVIDLALKVDELKTGIIPVLYHRGLAYQKKQLYGHAVSDLAEARQAATRKGQPRPEIDLALAQARAKDSDFEGAVRSIDRYLEHGGTKDAQLYMLWIESCYESGQPQRGLKILKEAVEQYPDNPAFKALAERFKQSFKIGEAEGSMSESGTMHFSIKFESGADNERVRKAAGKVLEAAYDRVTKQLAYYPKVTIPVVLYESHKSYVSATGSPVWSGGVYNRGDGTIRMGMNLDAYPEQVLVAKLAHEITHLVVDILSRQRVPAWINEGLAQISEQFNMTQSEMLLETVMDQNRGALPTLAALEKNIMADGRVDPKVGYAMAWSATRFLVARDGDGAMLKLLEQMGKGNDFEKALKTTYQAFQKEWMESLKSQQSTGGF